MFKLAAAILTLVALSGAVQFEIHNLEVGDIWVGIQGNAGKAPLHNGGFVLAPKKSVTIQSPADWAGRFWARTWCDKATKHCQTGDCGNRLECGGNGGAPPASLAEITLKGWGGLDYYDLSLVDGFNLRVSFEPQGGKGDGSQYSCAKAKCTFNINSQCPKELQLKNEAGVIGCKSACLAFNTDQYCCRGAHDQPETCKSSDWPVNYPAYFKKHCPDAYSYAYDDHKSTFTCVASKYIIKFGV